TLTLANVAGKMANFANCSSYTWRIATASGGITGFDATAIDLDLTGFQNAINGGVFTVENVGNDINIKFTAAPLVLNTVYVNSSWVGTVVGDDPDGAGPARCFGTDSFAT